MKKRIWHSQTIHSITESLSCTLVLILGLQLLPLSVAAQTRNRAIDADLKQLLFSTPHIGITATPYITPAARISKENTDRYQFNASVQRGFEAGIQYVLHLNEDWSIVTGLQVGFAGSNVRYHIPKEDLGASSQNDIIEKGRLSQVRQPIYISLPVLLEKRWFTDGKGYWSTSFGANLRREAEGFLESRKDYILYGGGWRVIFELDYDLEGPSGLWVNYNAGVGYHWLLKNKDIFSVRLVGNYSNTAIVEANYIFDLPNKPIESGTYRLNGSYIGVSAGYMLTKARKKLKRLSYTNERL